MEACWVSPHSWVGNRPSQMANTAAVWMLPLLSFCTPYPLIWSQYMHVLPQPQSPLFFLRMAPSVFPCFPSTSSPTQSGRFSLSQMFPWHFCQPRLFLLQVSLTEPEILPDDWLFVYIYTISIDTSLHSQGKALRLSSYVCLSSSEKGLQDEGIRGKEWCFPRGAHHCAQDIVWDNPCKGVAIMHYMHDIKV